MSEPTSNSPDVVDEERADLPSDDPAAPDQADERPMPGEAPAPTDPLDAVVDASPTRLGE